ncbi:hypothetical protein QUB63_09215 [Microcoleus sp. ARI1-B5]
MEYRYTVMLVAGSGDDSAEAYLQTIPLGTSEDGSSQTAHIP